MTPSPPELVEMVDLVFDLVGESLPRDYQGVLWAQVAARLPWLERETRSGLHPIRVPQTDGAEVLLSRRAKLTLRLPQARAGEACALEHREIDVSGHALQVGAARVRTLLPFPTLKAAFVARAEQTAAEQTVAEQTVAEQTAAEQFAAVRSPAEHSPQGRPVREHEARQISAADELAFEEEVRDLLEALGLGGQRFICGRLHLMRVGGLRLTGASVVLHDLNPQRSLSLQRSGLGPHRHLGCGLLVPHKTISGLD